MKRKKNDNGTVDMKKKTGIIQWVIAGILLLVVIFLALIGVITDYLWFVEIGYVSVFFTKLIAMLQIGIPTFAVIFVLSFIYLKALKRSYYKKLSNPIVSGDEKKITKITWGISALVGIVVSVIFTATLWFQFLQVVNSTSFGTDDPIFGLDISFYVFKLDFLTQLNSLIIVFVGIYVIMTVGYYAILMAHKKEGMFKEEETFESEPEEETFSGGEFKGSQKKNPFENTPFGNIAGGFFDGLNSNKAKATRTSSNTRNTNVNGNVNKDLFAGIFEIAKPQIIVLGIILCLMIAANFLLRQFDLLYDSTGTVYGAGYTDVHVTLWMYRVLIVLALAGIVAVIVSVKKSTFKPIAGLFVLMVLTGIIGFGAEVVVQKFVVTPDEISKETTYLERNIEYTQMAYDLQDVNIKEFSADDSLTSEDIANNSETIDNIRINDYTPAKQFYNQTESIRTYYTFNDVDVDRYTINGVYTQTFLSAREIDEDNVTDTWLNKHLKYTHGYGVVMSKVNEVTDSGQPEMIIGSIPPESSADEITITRPEIYFGEISNNYSIVGTNEEEFDYPDGDSNQYTEYEGTAGIKMTFLNRIMFAIKEKSINILVSSNIDDTSKIIIYKNVIERVNKIMPYITYENDPYMVVEDGKLYWIIDAYTSSDKFPYSEAYDIESGDDTNYIRNSIKVAVDAYNGDVSYYIVDEDDPIAMTLQSIYPDLFKDIDEMSEGLQEHLRYPAELLTIQAEIYRRYHMEETKVFYQNEDMWDIANEIYGTEEVTMAPNYYILKIPGEEDAEFVNSIAYTPTDKQNMTALLMARNDGDAYGELVLFQLPKSETIYGPMQIEAQIDQDTEISQDFTLWESSGSIYTRGNMFIIPIEDSLIYVEPVYLEATNSSIPEVKRVIVVYNNQIAYEETLGEALNVLFGEGSDTAANSATGGTSTDDSDTSSDDELSKEKIIALAVEAFDNAEEALASGDWTEYGKYMAEVSDYLTQLN